MLSLDHNLYFEVPVLESSTVKCQGINRRKNKNQKASGFQLPTNKENLDIFNLTKIYHNWTGEDLLFERTTQASPLPHFISEKERKNGKTSFFPCQGSRWGQLAAYFL